MSSGSYDEIWGYPYEQIEEYLTLCGALKKGDAYYAAGCTVIPEALTERRVGTLALPRTRVRMEGPRADSFHHAFLLHFLSGGG